MINVLKVLWERCTSKYFKLKSNIKHYFESEIKKKFSGRPRLSVRKDQNFLIRWLKKLFFKPTSYFFGKPKPCHIENH